MLHIERYDSEELFPKFLDRKRYVDFLHQALGEYRDSQEAINNAINYAFSESEGMGGFLLAAIENEKILGAVVMNKTGMSKYIPENILVYIAVDANQRGRGIGKKLMHKALQESEGNVALHVEYDNPARILYEKVGFTTKYAEMRYNRK